MAEAMPASKRAVPVAERRFRLKIAFSKVGSGATGGTFCTARWRTGTGICGAYHAFNWFLMIGRPQQKTKPVRKIHGSQAFHAGWPSVAGAGADSAGAAGATSRGCQNCMSTTSEIIETAAATMSTSHGP